MNDYKELIAELRKCKYCAKDIAKYAADALEQIVAEYNVLDAVEVVRCKDCIHSYDDLCGLCCTCGPYVDCIVRPDFYCADGKRRGAAHGVE